MQAERCHVASKFRLQRVEIFFARRTYRLIQDPGQTIVKELEVLRSMESAQEMAEEVLGGRTISWFRDGVEYQNQEELEAVRNKNLSRILENDMIVGHAPAGGVVLERLGKGQRGPCCSTVLARLTVLRSEQRSERTICLSGQVVMYVIAFTPFTGRTSANY